LQLGVEIQQSHDPAIGDIPAVRAGKVLLEEHGGSDEAKVSVFKVLIDSFHW
jgi:hypothetical protein